MKLSDVLSEGRIRVGVSADSTEEAATLLIRALSASTALDSEDASELAARLTASESGGLVRANQDVLIGAIESSDVEETAAALGVFPHGFPAPISGREGDVTQARVLLILVSNLRVSSLRAEAFPRLARAFRTKETTRAVLAAEAPSGILANAHLMNTDLIGALRVADAMSPVTLRVYPDTPLPEVLDLMARRGVHVLPVVGEEYQVLGLISGGDALGQMVQRIGRADDEDGEVEGQLARDVMSRTVLCVEEHQTLLEAARLMVNKGFERLPVVRDGELVGFVTEETALRMLSNAVT